MTGPVYVYLQQVFFDHCNHCRPECLSQDHKHTSPCGYCGQVAANAIRLTNEDYLDIKEGAFSTSNSPNFNSEWADPHAKKILSHFAKRSPLIKALVRQDQKMNAINALRDRTGCGLRSAKEAIERVYGKPNTTDPVITNYEPDVNF